METKYCTSCGAGGLNIKAEICSKCGVRQPALKKQTSIAAVILILIVVLFGGVAITGILAAIAIPQFAAYRTQGYNAAAKSDLKNVKIAIESYFAANQKYPDSLNELRVSVGKDVDVEMQKVDSNKYVVVAAHKNGNKIFMMNSGDSKMYYKDKSTPDAEFVPVQ